MIVSILDVLVLNHYAVPSEATNQSQIPSAAQQSYSQGHKELSSETRPTRSPAIDGIVPQSLNPNIIKSIRDYMKLRTSSRFVEPPN